MRRKLKLALAGTLLGYAVAALAYYCVGADVDRAFLFDASR